MQCQPNEMREWFVDMNASTMIRDRGMISEAYGMHLKQGLEIIPPEKLTA